MKNRIVSILLSLFFVLIAFGQEQKETVDFFQIRRTLLGTNTDSLLVRDNKGNVKHLPISTIKEPNKSVTIGNVGQSNALGWNPGGDMTLDYRVFVWRKDVNEWRVADLSLPPFNGNNNLAFHFAKKYAETYDVEVKLIVNAQGGESILRWSEDDGNDYMWTDLASQISASGTTKLDIILWHEGEALPDRNETFNFYATEMNKFHDRLHAQSWYDEDSPFIAGELTQTYPTVNNLYQNYRFNNAIKKKKFAVAPREELQGNPSDPVPYLHYTGEELVKFGREKYWNAFLSLNDPYVPQTRKIFSRPESTGISLGANAPNFLDVDFDADLYINSAGIVPVLIEKEGGALYFILQGYRDSPFGPIYESRVSNGTKESPTAILNTKNILTLSGLGYDGTTMQSGIGVIGNASENWTTTARGSNIEMWLTENGTTDYQLRYLFNGDGTLNLLTSSISKIDSDPKNATTNEWVTSKFESKTITTTFANLPASPTLGDEAKITDASSVTYRGIASGGGSDIAKVIYNGTNWIYN